MKNQKIVLPLLISLGLATFSCFHEENKQPQSNLAAIEIPSFDGLGYDKIVLSAGSLAEKVEMTAGQSTASLPIGSHMLTIEAFKGNELVASSDFAPCQPISATVRPVITNRVNGKICTQGGQGFESTPQQDGESNTVLDIEVVETHGLMKLNEMSCASLDVSLDFSRVLPGVQAYSKTITDEISWINYDGNWAVKDDTYTMSFRKFCVSHYSMGYP